MEKEKQQQQQPWVWRSKVGWSCLFRGPVRNSSLGGSEQIPLPVELWS